MVDAAEGIHHSDMEETKRRVGTDSDSGRQSCCPLQYPPNSEPHQLLALNLLSIAIMICFQAPKLLISNMPERTQKPPTPVPWEPKQGGGDGPRSPDVSKPDTKDLLKRMRKVDPNQSKRYRQRTGE